MIQYVFHPTFLQPFLTHSLSAVFLQLSTRFTQTHASLHFNECWCNRGSDELAVNQGLVNVNELPIVGVGKVGVRERARERRVFVCLSLVVATALENATSTGQLAQPKHTYFVPCDWTLTKLT